MKNFESLLVVCFKITNFCNVLNSVQYVSSQSAKDNR